MIAHPHHTLYTQPEILPAHKIRRSNTKTLRWLEKHQSTFKMTRDSFGSIALWQHKTCNIWHTRKPICKIYSVYHHQTIGDTAFTLSKPKTTKDSDVVDIVNTMVKGIDRRVNHTFFNNVSDFNASTQISMVLPWLPDTANFINITSWCNTVYHWTVIFLVFPWRRCITLRILVFYQIKQHFEGTVSSHKTRYYQNRWQ